MRGGITAIELADLELAYAPPFGSAKDPVNMLGYIADNVLSGSTAATVARLREMPACHNAARPQQQREQHDGHTVIEQ